MVWLCGPPCRPGGQKIKGEGGDSKEGRRKNMRTSGRQTKQQDKGLGDTNVTFVIV